MGKNNCDFVIVKDVLVRYKGLNHYVQIPSGVKRIGAQAFYCNDVISIVKIPEGVIGIDERAFSNCDNLLKVELPKSLLSIGHEAFSKCGSLTSIELPEGLEEIGGGAFWQCMSIEGISLPSSLKRIGDRAFESTKIVEISIPEGIKTIGNDTFNGCTKLERVKLPKSLEQIGYRAFRHCYKLRNIEFPTSITSIGDEAFDSCNELADQNGMLIINNILVYYKGNDRVIEVPEGITRINASAFSGQYRLAKIILPDSLTSIGMLAFENCTNLRYINIPSTVEDIHRTAFINCRKLADACGFIIFNNVLFEYLGQSYKVVIPDGVETIASGAFRGNKWVEEFFIPESVDTIESGVFDFCDNLVKAEMPDNKQHKSILNAATRNKRHLKTDDVAEKEYLDAVAEMEKFDGKSWAYLNYAIKTFLGILSYKDSRDKIKDCQDRLDAINNRKKEEVYNNALSLLSEYNGNNRDNLEAAIDMLERISGYKDSEEKLRDYYQHYWNIEI